MHSGASTTPSMGPGPPPRPAWAMTSYEGTGLLSYTGFGCPLPDREGFPGPQGDLTGLNRLLGDRATIPPEDSNSH